MSSSNRTEVWHDGGANRCARSGVYSVYPVFCPVLLASRDSGALGDLRSRWCGRSGKVDNCVVTVHLAYLYGDFKTLIDSDLYLPKKTWNADRGRCHDAHIPDDVVYRPKSEIALEQYRRAVANGICFDWLT